MRLGERGGAIFSSERGCTRRNHTRVMAIGRRALFLLPCVASALAYEDETAIRPNGFKKWRQETPPKVRLSGGRGLKQSIYYVLSLACNPGTHRPCALDFASAHKCAVAKITAAVANTTRVCGRGISNSATLQQQHRAPRRADMPLSYSSLALAPLETPEYTLHTHTPPGD